MDSNEEQPRNYLYIIGGYAVVIGGIYVYYKYSQNDRQRGRASAYSDRNHAVTALRHEAAQPRSKRQDSGRADETSTRRRRNNKPAKVSNPFENLPVEPTTDEPEADTQDLAYAESMAKLREGSKLTASRGKDVRGGNTAKAKKSAAKALSGNETGPLSEAPAPAVQSIQSPAVQASGIADMLEPAAKAPSSLLITPKAEKPTAVEEDGWAMISKAKKEPSKKTNMVSTDVESKKQRQNKRKADEQKARIEEGERIRQQKLEEQRRTARIARGEAAKDGSRQTARAINEWQQRGINGGAVRAPVVPAPVPAMLDTFESDGASVASSKDHAATSSSPISNSTANTNWGEGLPDEREQARIIAEQDDSTWNTVTDKKKNKRKPLKSDAGDVSGSELAKETVDTADAAGSNGVHRANGTNGVNPIKLAAPIGAPGDDADWSVA